MNNLDSRHFFPLVLQVIPTDNFELYVYFNDGSVRFFDANPILKKETVFERIMDIDNFKSKIRILNGTVAWDIDGNRNTYDCIDIDPLVIFDSPKIDDPLMTR